MPPEKARVLCVVRTLMLCSFVLWSFAAHARVLDVSIPPGRNYDKAEFRLWYPDDASSIRAIVILMPGSNGDGREMVEDPFWQEFARHHELALLGSYFADHQHEDMAIEEYVRVKDGSGMALLTSISRLAKVSSHPELTNAPLLLWGMSAGGEFNYEFVCWKPERVLAFVVDKGGVYYSALAPKRARQVPGIFFTGQNDFASRTTIIKGLFLMNRRFSAFWTFAQEPGVKHEAGESDVLAARFFEAIIPMRLPEKNECTTTHVSMREIVNGAGYLGDFIGNRVMPLEASEEDNRYSWLPNKSFAASWLEFIRGREIQ